MRKKFGEALADIKSAADAGITPSTTPDAVIKMDNAEVTDAYRRLPQAVAALDGVASLRDQLTETVGVGPEEWKVAAYLERTEGMADLGVAQAAYVDVPTSRVDDSNPLRRVTVHGVAPRGPGGKWLDLLTRGYELRLNTGVEAAQVTTAARAADIATDAADEAKD